MKGAAIFLVVAVIMSCSNSDRNNDFFRPGELWLDNNNVHVNAHGGGILLYDDLYYWYGEHKIEGSAGNKAHVGVHVYSSSDLFNTKSQNPCTLWLSLSESLSCKMFSLLEASIAKM